MGDLTKAPSWRKGGRTMTLEEYHRQPPAEKKGPSRGTPVPVGTPKPRTNWRERARCAERKLTHDYFFPSDEDRVAPTRIRAFCAECEVAGECLMWAVLSNTRDGWFGGMSPKERRQFAPASSRQHGTDAMWRYGLAGMDPANGCRCDVCRDYVAKVNRRRRETRPRAGEQAR